MMYRLRATIDGQTIASHEGDDAYDIAEYVWVKLGNSYDRPSKADFMFRAGSAFRFERPVAMPCGQFVLVWELV